MSERSLLHHSGVTLFCRIAAAAVFLFAAVSKIGDPVFFAKTISRYELVPSLANLGGAMLPWVELVLGLALLVGVWPRAAALGMCGLFALFIPALLWALAKGLKVDCGCFGGDEPLTAWTAFRDGVFLLPSLQAALSRAHRWILVEG